MPGICVVLIGLLFAVLYPLVRRYFPIFDWIVRVSANQLGTRGILGRTTLILTDESLVEITETVRSEVRWEDIHGVEQTDDHMFIFVTGLSAAILPRNGFCDVTQYESVREFVLNRVNQEGVS